MTRSARIYRRLLTLYSRALRREYGDAMAAAFDAMLRDARADGRPLPWLRTWSRALADLSATAAPDRMGQRPFELRQRRGKGGQHPRGRMMENALRDVRFALRTLLRQPLFTAVAALTIALGIGATTTIFTVAETMLLRTPEGVRSGDELVTLHRLGEDGSSFHAFSTPLYRHVAAAETGLRELAAYDTFSGGLGIDGGATMPVSGAMVSSNYFDTLGTRPVLGRFFTERDDDPSGGGRVAVISFDLWQRRFAADPNLVGRRVDLNGQDFVIVGVAEAGFIGHLAVFGSELWAPIAARATILNMSIEDAERIGGLELVGRLAAGSDLARARDGFDRAASLWSAQDEDRRGAWHGVDLYAYSPILPMARGGAIAFFSAMLAVAGILLTITAMNVASMLLSRGAARGREIAVRLALGASRRRLITQLLAESVVLFLIGGVLGTLLTVWLTGLAGRIDLPVPIPVDFNFVPNLRVYAFALGVAAVTGVIFGLSPALRATRGDLTSALKEGHGALPGQRQRGRAVLVVAQVAGSALLLLAAGLLARSLTHAGGVELGLEPEGVQAVEIDARLSGKSAEESLLFFEEALRVAASLPGVQAVAATDILPLTLSNQESFVVLPDRVPEPGIGLRRVDFAVVTPGYFEVLSIPLTAGRDFGAGDRSGSTAVAIVNETLARTIDESGSVIGTRIGFGSADDPTEVEIVGVSRNTKVRSIGDTDRPVIYLPVAQFRTRKMTLLVRSASTELAPLLRERIHDLDPVLPPSSAVPYRQLIGLSLLPGRIAAGLATAFGAVGLLLTAIGLYGLLAYGVTQREREIGVRIALGARAAEVRRLVVGDGMRLAGIGIALGLLAGAGFATLLRGFLFGVSPLDPITFLSIGLVLGAVAAFACWVPARRAAATDPVDALRSE